MGANEFRDLAGQQAQMILRRALRVLRSSNYSLEDRTFGLARRWSNAELRKFAGLFTGSVVNVSAWEDRDKEGGFYADYFSSSSSYYITNFGTYQGQLQNLPNEYFLDLESDLDPAMRNRFDVVFNHTTLEHVWDFRKAIGNICGLSSDMVVIVVPWLQPLHANYGDYWRFSPQAAARLLEELGFTVLYLSWNDHVSSSVYVFAVATRNPDKWSLQFPDKPAASSDARFLELPPVPPGARALE